MPFCMECDIEPQLFDALRSPRGYVVSVATSAWWYDDWLVYAWLTDKHVPDSPAWQIASIADLISPKFQDAVVFPSLARIAEFMSVIREHSVLVHAFRKIQSVPVYSDPKHDGIAALSVIGLDQHFDSEVVRLLRAHSHQPYSP